MFYVWLLLLLSVLSLLSQRLGAIQDLYGFCPFCPFCHMGVYVEFKRSLSVQFQGSTLCCCLKYWLHTFYFLLTQKQ